MLRQARRRRLAWDPLAEPVDGYTGYFQWAIDHEKQDENDLCWAACLRNALTAFGRYPEQDEILDRFKPDDGGSPDEEEESDDRIPLAQIVDLWRSYGFTRAVRREEPLSFADLRAEITTNGPVLIELWRDATQQYHHLALVCGVREKPAAQEVRVSDPKDTRPRWIAYEKLRGPEPLDASSFGSWRRTYVGLRYENGRYLRRFFDQPLRALVALGTQENGGTAGPDLPDNGSLLKLDPVFRLDPPLTSELTLACYGYRYYRWRSAEPAVKKQREADLARPLFLHESIRICRPPFQIDYGKELKEQLELLPLWHHQVHDPERPRYYARVRFFAALGQRADEAWCATWLGERWLAQRVDDAIRELDAQLGGHDETVRMVWFRRHGLLTLLLTDSNLHIVVSARGDRQRSFPLLERFTDERLRAVLAGL